jgi:hypothetical protein
MAAGQAFRSVAAEGWERVGRIGITNGVEGMKRNPFSPLPGLFFVGVVQVRWATDFALMFLC